MCSSSKTHLTVSLFELARWQLAAVGRWLFSSFQFCGTTSGGLCPSQGIPLQETLTLLASSVRKIRWQKHMAYSVRLKDLDLISLEKRRGRKGHSCNYLMGEWSKDGGRLFRRCTWWEATDSSFSMGNSSENYPHSQVVQNKNRPALEINKTQLDKAMNKMIQTIWNCPERGFGQENFWRPVLI